MKPLRKTLVSLVGDFYDTEQVKLQLNVTDVLLAVDHVYSVF